MSVPFGFMAGLEANKLSDYVMRFSAGACASANGSSTITFSSSRNDVNMKTIGPWGLDQGAPQAGVGYFPYVISRDGGMDNAIVMSASRFYSDVALPDGYAVLRKISFGIVLDEFGIPNFHAGHWPKPAVTLTELRPPALSQSVCLDPIGQEFSVSRWVPDNARLAWLHCEVGVGARAGTVYLRPPGVGAWMPVGNANPVSGVRSISVVPVRCSSQRTIAFYTTGNAMLTARVVRYEMTEPMC